MLHLFFFALWPFWSEKFAVVISFYLAAVDKLMESDFHKKIEKGKDAPMIPDRDSAIALM